MMGKYIPVTTFHQTERECVGKWVCGICSHSQLQRPLNGASLFLSLCLIKMFTFNLCGMLLHDLMSFLYLSFAPSHLLLFFSVTSPLSPPPTLPGRGAFAMDALHVLSRGMALHRIRSLWPAPPHPPQLNWIMLFYMGPSVCPLRGTPILLYLGVEEEERVGGVWSRRKWSFSDRDLSFNGLHEKGHLIFVFPILFQHGMSVTWPPTIDTEQSSSVGFKDDHSHSPLNPASTTKTASESLLLSPQGYGDMLQQQLRHYLWSATVQWVAISSSSSLPPQLIVIAASLSSPAMAERASLLKLITFVWSLANRGWC